MPKGQKKKKKNYLINVMYLISLWIDFGKISLFIHLFIYFSLKHSS